MYKVFYQDHWSISPLLSWTINVQGLPPGSLEYVISLVMDNQCTRSSTRIIGVCHLSCHGQSMYKVFHQDHWSMSPLLPWTINVQGLPLGSLEYVTSLVMDNQCTRSSTRIIGVFHLSCVYVIHMKYTKKIDSILIFDFPNTRTLNIEARECP